MRRDDVYFSLFAQSPAEACAETWRAGMAFFAWEGRVYLVLGVTEWFDASVEVRELTR